MMSSAIHFKLWRAAANSICRYRSPASALASAGFALAAQTKLLAAADAGRDLDADGLFAPLAGLQTKLFRSPPLWASSRLIWMDVVQIPARLTKALGAGKAAADRSPRLTERWSREYPRTASSPRKSRLIKSKPLIGASVDPGCLT